VKWLEFSTVNLNLGFSHRLGQLRTPINQLDNSSIVIKFGRTVTSYNHQQEIHHDE
jgi:hypothetical protein